MPEPFCASSPEAQLLSDGEFWEAVYLQGDPDAIADRYTPDPPELEPWEASPCPVCHASGACGFDMEGRPLIHALGVDDDA